MEGTIYLKGSGGSTWAGGTSACEMVWEQEEESPEEAERLRQGLPDLWRKNHRRSQNQNLQLPRGGRRELGKNLQKGRPSP